MHRLGAQTAGKTEHSSQTGSVLWGAGPVVFCGRRGERSEHGGRGYARFVARRGRVLSKVASVLGVRDVELVRVSVAHRDEQGVGDNRNKYVAL